MQITRYLRSRKAFNTKVKNSTYYKGEDTYSSTTPMTQLRDPDTGTLRTDGAGIKHIAHKIMQNLMDPPCRTIPKDLTSILGNPQTQPRTRIT